MNWVRTLDWTTATQVFAQAAPEGAEPLPEGAAPRGGGSIAEVLLSPFNFMLMIFVLFFFLVLWPQQRQMKAQQKALAQTLANLKKNDRVITTGGVHGTVMQTTPEAGTVTLRIDESSGAKMTVSREAIARVVTSDVKST